MYCTNCGKPNDDSAKFCPYCGNALQQPVKSSSTVGMKNKLVEAVNKLTKKQKITIIATVASILVIVLIIVFAFSCGAGAKSPEALVENYVAAFNSGKVDSIVKCYLDDCRKIYQSDNINASNEDFLEDYDEFCDDFLGRTITSYEIDEIEYFDADHEYYENMREYGIDVKGGARAIVDMDFSSSDADAIIFMVKTNSGWYIYMVNDWY